MAINDTYAPVKVSGDGVTTLFSFDFVIYGTADLLVTLVDKTTGLTTATLALGSGYSVAISPITEGGTITCVVAPAATVWVLIESKLQLSQPTAFNIDSKFSVKAIETALDRQCRLTQQLADPVNRSVKVPASLASAGLNLEIPPPVAGQVIGFDSTATKLVLYTPGGGGGGGGIAIPIPDSSLQVIATPGKVAASALPIGTTAGKVIALDGAGKLPAVNGSLLTNLPATGAAAASKAEQIAATITTKYANPGVQQFHPSACKAWVIFDGTAGTILASYGVTSVTKNATGDFTVTFSTPFTSSNYAVLATPGNYLNNYCGAKGGSVNNTTARVSVPNTIGTLVDSETICVAAFGTQ